MDATNIDNKIKQQFRSKFDRFESKPPVDGWDKLEASLNAATASKFVIRRRWFASAAAAVLALVVGGALFLWSDTEQVEASHVAHVSPEIVSEELPQPQEIEIIPPYEITPSHNLQPMFAQVSTSATLSDRNIVVPQIEHIETPEAVVTERSRSVEEENIEQPRTQPTGPSENQLNNNQLSEEFILIAGINDHFFNDLPTRRRRENISVSVGGRGGLAPFHTEVNTPVTLRAAAVEADDAIFGNRSYTTHHEAEKIHAPPISFGATVSIPLAPNLFIETGLVYSFLFSRTRNDNVSRHEQETQHLHYLGIPLIINYRVLQLNNFNLYASAGGMVEQGIHGAFQRVAVQGEGESTLATGMRAMETVHIRQSNPQLSVNAGIGASVPIHNRFRLHGRIGGAYYFDARNAHRTIYSDRKIVLDLNLGVRYEF